MPALEVSSGPGLFVDCRQPFFVEDEMGVNVTSKEAEGLLAEDRRCVGGAIKIQETESEMVAICLLSCCLIQTAANKRDGRRRPSTAVRVR